MSNVIIEFNSLDKDTKQLFTRRYSSDEENSYVSEHYEPIELKKLVEGKGVAFSDKDLTLIRNSSSEFQVTLRNKKHEKCFKCKKRLNFTYGFCPRCNVKL